MTPAERQKVIAAMTPILDAEAAAEFANMIEGAERERSMGLLLFQSVVRYVTNGQLVGQAKTDMETIVAPFDPGPGGPEMTVGP